MELDKMHGVIVLATIVLSLVGRVGFWLIMSPNPTHVHLSKQGIGVSDITLREGVGYFLVYGVLSVILVFLSSLT